MNLEAQRKLEEVVNLLSRKALVYPYMIRMGLSEKPKDAFLFGRVYGRLMGKVNT